MRTRHAREIRKGLLAARNEVRGRRENDIELLIRSVWAVNRLNELGWAAYHRSWRKKWYGPLSQSDQHVISAIRGVIEENEGS